MLSASVLTQLVYILVTVSTFFQYQPMVKELALTYTVISWTLTQLASSCKVILMHPGHCLVDHAVSEASWVSPSYHLVAAIACRFKNVATTPNSHIPENEPQVFHTERMSSISWEQLGNSGPYMLIFSKVFCAPSRPASPIFSSFLNLCFLVD